MKTRLTFLFLANLLGVLVLTGIVALQWTREETLRAELVSQAGQLESARGKWREAETRAASLETDISQLKEALASTVQARAEAEQQLARLNAENSTQATEAKDKIATWEKALAERDARIHALNATLAATRKRLDEAISRLKPPP